MALLPAASKLIGQQYGRLTVVSAAAPLNNRKSVRCKCTCGGEKIVNVKDLKRGSVKSCGCLLREVRSQNYMRKRSSFARSKFRGIDSLDDILGTEQPHGGAVATRGARRP